MKRFRYRLETVLKVRRRREEIEQKKYLQLGERLAGIERQIQQVDEENRRILDESADEMQAVVDLGALRRGLAYAEYLVRERAALSYQREQVEAARQQQYAVLTEIMKKRKILETLKEKAFARFNFAVSQQEQKDLDEWSVTNQHRSASDN